MAFQARANTLKFFSELKCEMKFDFFLYKKEYRAQKKARAGSGRPRRINDRFILSEINHFFYFKLKLFTKFQVIGIYR